MNKYVINIEWFLNLNSCPFGISLLNHRINLFLLVDWARWSSTEKSPMSRKCWARVDLVPHCVQETLPPTIMVQWKMGCIFNIGSFPFIWERFSTETWFWEKGYKFKPCFLEIQIHLGFCFRELKPLEFFFGWVTSHTIHGTIAYLPTTWMVDTVDASELLHHLHHYKTS